MSLFYLKNPWILAPMAGVSEMPFRVLARRFGAAQAPTELVSAKGLLYGQKRTERYVHHHPLEANDFWVQLFGGDTQSMVAAGHRAIELGAKWLDINMGCPVKKVTRHGAGSALLCDIPRAAHMVEALVKQTGVPITVKIRAGWDEHSLNYKDMGKALQEAGASAVALHARTRAQGYSGRANWDYIADLVEVLDIPVIGNGDAFTADLARQLQHHSQCHAVMVGRGALGNPWVFAELTGQQTRPPSPAERFALVMEHLFAHLDFSSDIGLGLRRFRPHLMWYSHGLTQGAAFRAQVCRLETLEAVLAACEDFFLSSGVLKAEDEPLDYNEKNALG